jgi:hypothetical protein
VTIAAQRARAAGVVMVLCSPVVDTLLPRGTPTIISIPTFSLSKDSGTRLFESFNVSIHSSGTIGTLALPELERGSAQPIVLPTDRAVSDTYVRVLSPPEVAGSYAAGQVQRFPRLARTVTGSTVALTGLVATHCFRPAASHP